jgi:hypothetical protein
VVGVGLFVGMGVCVGVVVAVGCVVLVAATVVVGVDLSVRVGGSWDESLASAVTVGEISVPERPTTGVRVVVAGICTATRSEGFEHPTRVVKRRKRLRKKFLGMSIGFGLSNALTQCVEYNRTR